MIAPGGSGGRKSSLSSYHERDTLVSVSYIPVVLLCVDYLDLE